MSTDTHVSVTLAAIADSLRAQIAARRAEAESAEIVEYRLTVAEILAASEQAGALDTATMEALAEVADMAAQGRAEPRAIVDGWRFGCRTLPAPLLAQCPAARERALKNALDVIEDAPRYHRWAPQAFLLPDDVSAQMEDALAAFRREKEEKEERARQARAHETERRASHLDALARHVLSSDDAALAGWDAGEIRPQEVTGRVQKELRAAAGDLLTESDTRTTVERISVAAYREGRQVLARLRAAASAVATALSLLCEVRRVRYERQTVVQYSDEYETRTDRYWTASYEILIGDLRWHIEDVVLDQTQDA